MLKKNTYCADCGFKNNKSDQFCGGCGNKLNIKPKKKRNYATFFFVLTFLFSLGNLTSPELGFELSSSSPETAGYNFGVAFWYISYIATAIWVILQARKNDSLESSKTTEKDSKKKPKKLFRTTGFVAGTLVILIATAIWSINTYTPTDVTPIIEDAIYGTNQSEQIEFVDLLSQIFSGYQQGQSKEFPATLALDSSNVLEFDSYETKESLKNSIDLLSQSISELDRADEIIRLLKEEAREQIRDSYLSEEEKASMLSSFNSSANDADRTYLTQRRYKTLQQTYQEMLELYNFLLSNFSDYEIDFDEYGYENIFFYSDKNINLYNTHMEEIQKASLRFVEAEEALIENVNKQFSAEGVDINAEDLVNSIFE